MTVRAWLPAANSIVYRGTALQQPLCADGALELDRDGSGDPSHECFFDEYSFTALCKTLTAVTPGTDQDECNRCARSQTP